MKKKMSFTRDSKQHRLQHDSTADETRCVLIVPTLPDGEKVFFFSYLSTFKLCLYFQTCFKFQKNARLSILMLLN